MMSAKKIFETSNQINIDCKEELRYEHSVLVENRIQC